MTNIELAEQTGASIVEIGGYQFFRNIPASFVDRFAALLREQWTAELLAGVEMPEPVGYRQWLEPNPKLEGYWMFARPETKAMCSPQLDWQPIYTATQLREVVVAAVLRERAPLTFEEIENCFPEGGESTPFGEVTVNAQWLHDFAAAIRARKEQT
jgi:hypothetical protein